MAKALLETLALVNSSPGGSNVLKAVPNTPVYVYLAGTSTLADLFLDAAGTLPTANPTTTDGYGNIGPPAGSPAVSQALYVEEGADYDVTINGVRQRVRVPAGGSGALDADLVSIAALDATQSGVMASDGAGWVRKTYAALKTALGLTKADVGLSNVDNTSDANKPVSTAQQAALDLREFKATSVWVPADLMQLAQGAPNRTVFGSTPVWGLPDASSTGVTAQLVLPASWQTFSAELWWVNAGAVAGNVRFVWIQQTIAIGSTLLGNFSSPTVVAAGAQFVVAASAIGGIRTAPAAGAVTQVGVSRSGADAADTLAASVGVVGLWLFKVS